MEIIRASENRKYKLIKSLAQKKYRDEHGLFIIEGEKFVNDIPKGEEPVFFIFSEEYCRKNKDPRQNGFNSVVLADSLYGKLSDAVTPQGIAAVCRKRDFSLNSIMTGKSLIVILEELNNPGNVGTIIRTAAAAGADAVIVSKNSADIYSPKVLQATASAIFSLPIVTDVDVCDAILFLKNSGVTVYGSSLGSLNDFYDLDYTGSAAFVVGNEARGVSEEALKLCDKDFIIPISEKVDSLNASTAATVMLFEAIRQRQKPIRKAGGCTQK